MAKTAKDILDGYSKSSSSRGSHEEKEDTGTVDGEDGADVAVADQDHRSRKKKLRKTERPMTTALFMLRCVELGLNIADLDLLTIGSVNDMFNEKSRDSIEWRGRRRKRIWTAYNVKKMRNPQKFHVQEKSLSADVTGRDEVQADGSFSFCTNSEGE